MHRRSFLAALSALVGAPASFLQPRPLGTSWMLQKKLFARIRLTNPVITDDVYRYKSTYVLSDGTEVPATYKNWPGVITYVTKDGREVDGPWAAAHPEQMTPRGIWYGARPA